MDEIKVDRKSISVVEYDGKEYTCNGERTWVNGQVVWMYTDKTGLPYDIIVCSDRYSENPNFIKINRLPGEPEPRIE